MGKLRRKLKSSLGFTLTEMLLSVALLGIFFSVTTVGVNASAAVYRKSIAVSDAQTLSSSIANAIMGELRYARNIKAVSGGGVTFDSETFGLGVSVVSEALDADGRERVYISGGGKSYDLLEKKAYTGLLEAHTDIVYHPETGLFTVTVTVYSEDAPTRVSTVTVRALNP